MNVHLMRAFFLLVMVLAMPLMADQNLAPNAGFEDDAGGGVPLQWTPAPPAEFGKNLQWAKEGRDGSAAITIRTPAEGSAGQWSTVVTNVEPGKRYEASIWISAEATDPALRTGAPQFKVVQLNAAGQVIGRPAPGIPVKHAQTILNARLDKPGWQELSAKFTTDDDVKSLLLLCQMGKGFKGVARFDDVRITLVADDRPENAYYTKVDTSVATPHTPWARPLVDGKLKVFCLLNNPGKRELVELWQRLDMDFEAVVAISPSTLGYSAMASRFKGNSEQEKLAELREKLKADYDMYLIGNFDWDALPIEMRHTIFERAAGGKGLVFVFAQERPTDELKLLRDSAEPAGAQWILSGLPLSRMRMGMIETHAGFRPAAQPLSNLVKSSRIKEGRAVFLDYPYPKEERYKGFSGSQGIYQGAALCPFIPFDPHQTHEYEYAQQLLARAVLWAAKREPRSTLVLEKNVVPAGAAPVVVRIENPPAAPGRLWYRLLSSKGQVLANGTKESTGQSVALDLGFLPAAEAQLELRLLDGGERVQAFATHALTIEGPARVAEVKVDNAKVNDGLLKGAVGLSGAAAGKLRLRMSDIHGRLVLDQTLPVAGPTVPFEFPLPKIATARLHDLHAELLDEAGRTIALDKTMVCVPQPEKQDVSYYAWSSAWFGCMPMQWLNRFCRERFGMTDLYDPEICLIARVAGKNGFARATHPGTTASLAFDQATIPYNLDVIYRGSALQRIPCLSDPAYRKAARNYLQIAARYYRDYGVRPPFYSLGDEFLLAYPGGPDVCFADSTQKSFRAWLQKKYGSIEKLNEIWGTSYKAWDEVSPITMADAQTQNQPARWLDHRLHMDEVVIDFIEMGKQAVLEMDPQAKIGFEGMFRSYSECGYDMERITEQCAWLMSYEYPYRWEMLASFMPPGATFGLWSNGHGSVEASNYQVWKQTAHGLNAIGWWRMNGEPGVVGFDLATGGSPGRMPGVANQAAQVAAVRKGPARLLHAAPRIDQPVAILHSQTSLHMGKFDTGEAATLSAAWSAWQFILDDLGVGYRYVKSSEIDKVTVDNTKVLVLPYAVSLPNNVVAAVKRYVESGGTVMADVRAGARDGFGRPAKSNPLEQVLGISRSGGGGLKSHDSPLGKIELETGLTLTPGASALGAAQGIPYGIVHGLGRGRAITLNFLPSAYGASFTASDFAIVPYRAHFTVNAAVADIVRKLLEPAGVRPSFGVGAPGANTPGFEQFLRSKHQTRLLMIVRKFFSDFYGSQPAQRTVYLGHKAHVYDVRSRKYLGFADQVPIDLKPGESALLAALPYMPRFVQMRGTLMDGAIVVSGRIDTADAKDVHHVLHVQVTDPGGKQRSEEDRNLTLDKPAIDFRIPLPLNAAKGRWTVRVMDVGSDQEIEVPAVVE